MYNPDEECKAMIIKLKKLCKQKNITPHALAKEAGISTSTISYLMNGRTKPQVYTVLILCNVLSVTISELFDDDKDNVTSPGQIKIGAWHMTGEEEKLVNSYQCLSAKKKEMLKIYLDMLLQYDDDYVYTKT